MRISKLYFALFALPSARPLRTQMQVSEDEHLFTDPEYFMYIYRASLRTRYQMQPKPYNMQKESGVLILGAIRPCVINDRDKTHWRNGEPLGTA